MRISDWSSDVCSSDLLREPNLLLRTFGIFPLRSFRCPTTPKSCHDPHCSLNRSISPRRRFADRPAVPGVHDTQGKAEQRGRSVTFVTFRAASGPIGRHQSAMALRRRSEEHTSELQSLMRISYAVFCLKKKTQQK